MCGKQLSFVSDTEVVEDFSGFCMVAQSDFEPMIMEITGFIFFSFLIMVLGGGDGSKPSVSFLNIEPKVSMFPRPEQKLFWSSFTTATIIGFGDFVA